MTQNPIRTAIITGASRGIGAATAERLAQDGFAVIVNYARGREAAEAIVARITAVGGQALAVAADVASPEGVPTLFDAAEEAFGPVNVLVNNAGLLTVSPLVETDDASFDRQIALNLGGVFRGMREGARRLRDGGRILSFSSSVVGVYQPTYGIYAATKAAVEAMTHVLAKELGPRGISVNCVAPGPVATDLFLEGKSEALIHKIASSCPFNRLGTPEEIARVISFLAGPDGAWVNGQVLRANGGMI
ncbi:SDR family oxidoreductase [Rhodospirillum sp. A1_3_36]|uniref:SDR family oxidoreductase n=1 Tax=Rhodospirillum sp. A1_3_36 TaxID=3391666 RepID=UPI0039A489D2